MKNTKNKKGSKTKVNAAFKPHIKVIMIITLIVFFVSSIIFVYFGQNPVFFNQSKVVYAYSSNSNVDYKVQLLPNDFYENEYLDMGKLYPSSLIDKIDVNFDYVYSGSKKGNLNYTYELSTIITGEYESAVSGAKEIWSYIYQDEKDASIVTETTGFNIEKSLSLNYDELNQIVNQYRETIGLAISAHADIKLTVYFNNAINDVKNPVTDKIEMLVSIPLATPAMQITTDYEKLRKNDITRDGDKPGKNKVMIYSGCVLLICAFITLMLLFKKIFISDKTMYQKILEKISKNYGEVIVEVSELPDLSSLTILDIKEFNDMLDIVEAVNYPILYQEVHKNREALFVIITEKYVYRYVLKR